MIYSKGIKTSEVDVVWYPVRFVITGNELSNFKGEILIESKGLDPDTGQILTLTNSTNFADIERIPQDHVLRSGSTFAEFMNDFCGLAEDIRQGVVPIIIQDPE